MMIYKIKIFKKHKQIKKLRIKMMNLNYNKAKQFKKMIKKKQ
jgi:hypothetical protein